uniref:Uncharacterized protein LOC111116495 n=1 Tax=Crassostrea virginica TaxID=6565 RepID=A0A8B8C661_CRAVI|nr:uncharacterized protein LOC111116495 [Crassostrea virginica]
MDRNVLTFFTDDLSQLKSATQSTTATGPDDLYKAGNAVDRATTTCTRTYAIGPNNPDKTVWWKVDLGGVYNIYSVNILFKNYERQESRQRGRFAGFSVYVSNDGERESLCYKDGPELPPLNITITCHRSGRYVIFYNERLDGVTYPTGYEVSSNVVMELCEVIVHGCNIDVFGSNCNKPCPNYCKTNTCHIQDGSCIGCKPGWTGRTCNEICVQSFGENCQYSCSTNGVNKTCDRFTGECLCVCEEGSKGGDRFSDIDSDTHSTFWSYGGPISVGINVVLIIGAFIGLWAVYSKRMFVSFKQQSSARSDLYTETGVIAEDSSHYQELGVSVGETPYQNTSLNH